MNDLARQRAIRVVESRLDTICRVLREHTGLSIDQLKMIFRKWRAAASAAECIWGDDRALAIDCTCPGCLERLCFLYFDQVPAAMANIPRPTN